MDDLGLHDLNYLGAETEAIGPGIPGGVADDRVGAHRLFAVGAAADYLGVSRATVERLVFRGELPIVKVGGATRYDVGDLDGYIEINRRRNRRRSA